MVQTRQLAAIMFTDIVGYTALMGKDEQEAFALLNKNREIQKPIIEHYNGVLIKEIGDGILASFHSVSDAALCAKDIQNACLNTPGLQLRIGIHLGEVVFEDNDVFGDGVNIASRLQSLAPAGGIWVSESVHNNVVNKKGIETRFVRKEILKNVKEPVRIYEIKLKDSETRALQGSPSISFPPKKQSGRRSPYFVSLGILALLTLGYFLYNAFNKSGKTIGESNVTGTIEKSIAVLPFVNMNKDNDQEWFSDGLSEELLNLLSRISELKVIGRTSSFSFKGKNEDLRVIGEKLGVANLLEGSVQKEGNNIRVTVRLIRASDGSQLWSEKYDRDIQGIFKMQDEIAGAVVKQLKLKLMALLKTASPQTKIEVYDLILQGNYLAEMRDKENLAKALDFYLKALEIDSLNARSWAAVARCYNLQSIWGWIDRNKGYEKAREAATKSIKLDDAQSEGYMELGVVKMYEFDWAGAEVEYQKALNLDPGNADILRTIGFLYRCIGRYDEAVRLTKQSISLDPVKPITYFNLGTLLHYANRLEEAIEAYKKVLEFNPQFPRARMLMGEVHLFQGKPETTLSEIQEETEKNFKDLGLALVYHALRRKKEADEALTNYITNYQSVLAYQIAEIYAFRGEKDKAFQWLEKAYARKENWLAYLKGDPLLKNLEGDPRHKAFLKKLNLPLN